MEARLSPVVRLSAYGAYSWIVDAEDEDLHYQRPPAGWYFDGEFDHGDYVGLGLAVTGSIPRGPRQRFNVSLALDYQHISEIVGDMTVTDRASGAVLGFYEDAASVEHESTTVTLSFSWAFNTGFGLQ